MQKKGREKRCNKNKRGHTSIYHCFAFFSFNFENVTMKKGVTIITHVVSYLRLNCV